MQERDVYCRLKGTGQVREDLCDAHQRLAIVQPCQSEECITHYTWVAGEWEEVSTDSFFLYKFPMNRCLTISLRFLLAEISALSLCLCTVKRTTCRYPFSLTSIVRALVITISRQITSNLRAPMAIIPFLLLNITVLCHASRLLFSLLIFL